MTLATNTKPHGTVWKTFEIRIINLITS